MTEYKTIVKMRIPEVQFHASDNLTQILRTKLSSCGTRESMGRYGVGVDGFFKVAEEF